ncbi:MAG: alpha/beta-type small acid-soluble spore protein [Anaeroplasma sp.]|nr:alpha/beta-type small acid-soluble spore protein [Anaeroplasma sp.]
MANNKRNTTANSSQENGSIGGNMTKRAVEAAKKTTDTQSLKQEVANELGITPGKNATAQENGRVGGEMTKKLYNKGSKKSNN